MASLQVRLNALNHDSCTPAGSTFIGFRFRRRAWATVEFTVTPGRLVRFWQTELAVPGFICCTP